MSAGQLQLQDPDDVQKLVASLRQFFPFRRVDRDDPKRKALARATYFIVARELRKRSPEVFRDARRRLAKQGGKG